MTEMEHLTLERNGALVHYWLGGKSSAPLVIFTHGATIDHHEWDATLPPAAQKFRVLAWDVRGHGLSRPGKFSLQDAILDMAALMDAVKAKQAIFVGHSMGGNLEQEFAFQFPEHVRAMVCLDCTWNFQRLTVFEKAMLSSAKQIFSLYSYENLVKQSLDVTVTSPSGREILEKAMRVQSKDEYVQIMMDLALCLHEEPDYHFDKPLLLLMGEKESTGNIKKAMPIWAKHESNCRFVIIPNARHAANLDNPDFFNRELFQFLDEQTAR
jgi:3-oxoadipate enol-lactonase